METDDSSMGNEDSSIENEDSSMILQQKMKILLLKNDHFYRQWPGLQGCV